MRASRFRHGHKTLLLKDHFYFVTQHERIPRDTRRREPVRLDSEHRLTACLRPLPAPRNCPYCNSIVSRLRFRRMAFLPRLLADLFLEQIAQPGTRFMQLRLGISDRTPHDGGNFSIERSRFTRSTAPLSLKSGAPGSLRGPPLSSSGSLISSREATGSDFLRRRINTTFTVMRCSHVENADSPRNVPTFRNSCRNASCMRSSASDGFPTIRKHKA